MHLEIYAMIYANKKWIGLKGKIRKFTIITEDFHTCLNNWQNNWNNQNLRGNIEYLPIVMNKHGLTDVSRTLQPVTAENTYF